MKTIKQCVLHAPLEGLNLQPGTLKTQLADYGPTMLVFLRHFGCIFCRETIRDLRRLAQKDPNYPPILFFYQGYIEDGEWFFRQAWPEARAVADIHKYFYKAFSLERGSIRQMFGAGVWACGLRAASKGHFVGAPLGDPWQMPGVFLVENEQIVWQHAYRHAGDHPNWRAIKRRVQHQLA